VPQHPQEPDIASWHRYFAVECNNTAWDLAGQARTADEDEQMLQAAHAAAFHWDQVGEELHRMRAKMLLAEVHALLGMNPSALQYAEEMQAYFLDRDTPDWEIAFAHAIYAHAAHVAGDFTAHARAYRDALQALDAIADPESQMLVQITFDQVPPPEP
jgi:hypothetical protein